jgi:hypothetical protein
LSYRVFARWRWVRKWSPSYSPATTP